MIDLINIASDLPHNKFLYLYQKALKENQRGIEAVAISSYDKSSNEVESRFVNLKYITDNEWIFFSNYLSPKAMQFESHDQISALFHWGTINSQIRLKAKIKKTSVEFSDNHFQSRSKDKNALAISSKQSQPIDSFDSVKENFHTALASMDPESKRPEYWGGYSFTPYYFEFWEGHENRLNQRHVFSMEEGSWSESLLQP
ncbi:pyridoxamine 5'-phosphate oxidase family protein [Gammaproteobacteria bacterium]|nr:pyridoxamine 5'-phosphate oxidase family protein [Gammaproteobacteria bacterium]